MGIEKLILRMMLGFYKPFLLLCKIQPKKVTFISLTMTSLNTDFQKIVNELANSGLDVHFNLVKFKKTKWGKFKYLLNCFRQMHDIYTSKVVVINDNNYVVSQFKRKGVIVVQIWHACGAIKKFGNQIQRAYKISNYDYVISCADAWKPAYAQAFGVKMDQVITCGLPRTDVLCDQLKVMNMRNKMLQKDPRLANKYIYLYAPTFRGNIMNGFHHETLPFDDMIKKLPDECVILYKMHPLLGDIHMGYDERIINVNQADLNALFCVADCLISDYSSIIFDFSILQKRMIFYVPDIDEYKKTVGLNVNYQTMPGAICTNVEALITSMQDVHSTYQKELAAFRKKYMPATDGHNAKRIAALILKQCR